MLLEDFFLSCTFFFNVTAKPVSLDLGGEKILEGWQDCGESVLQEEPSYLLWKDRGCLKVVSDNSLWNNPSCPFLSSRIVIGFFWGNHFFLSQQTSSLLYPVMLYGSKKKWLFKRTVFLVLFSFRLPSLLRVLSPHAGGCSCIVREASCS